MWATRLLLELIAAGEVTITHKIDIMVVMVGEGGKEGGTTYSWVPENKAEEEPRGLQIILINT